jgi:hypothetical protein
MQTRRRAGLRSSANRLGRSHYDERRCERLTRYARSRANGFAWATEDATCAVGPEGECTDGRKETTMKKGILPIAAALMFASPAFTQNITPNGGAPVSISPNASLYPAPLTNFSNTSGFVAIGGRR